jgi:hypothetical protein
MGAGELMVIDVDTVEEREHVLNGVDGNAATADLTQAVR